MKEYGTHIHCEIILVVLEIRVHTMYDDEIIPRIYAWIDTEFETKEESTKGDQNRHNLNNDIF